MQYDFEVFEKGAVEDTSRSVHVTISREGVFFLNAKAVAALGGVEVGGEVKVDAVQLMFDRRRSVIGIKSVKFGAAGSYRLRRKERNMRSGARVLYAANFFRHYSMRPSETLAFTEPRVNADGVLVLDLNAVRSVGKG